MPNIPFWSGILGPYSGILPALTHKWFKKNLFFFFFFSFEGEGIDREEDIKKYCEVIAIDEFGEWYMEVHDIIFTSFLSF